MSRPYWEQMDWFADYEGLPWREAVEKARREGHPVRIMRPGQGKRTSLRPNRLNVYLDEKDELVRMNAG